VEITQYARMYRILGIFPLAKIPGVTSKFPLFSPIWEILLLGQQKWGQVFHFTIFYQKIILIPGVHKKMCHIPNFRFSKIWEIWDFFHVSDTDFIFDSNKLREYLATPLQPLGTSMHVC